jgi:hypothetical protein
MPPRLFLEEELGPLILAMQNKALEKAQGKPKAGGGGGSSSPQHYGRGKRIREVSEIAGGCILWPLQLVHLSSAVDCYIFLFGDSIFHDVMWVLLEQTRSYGEQFTEREFEKLCRVEENDGSKKTEAGLGRAARKSLSETEDKQQRTVGGMQENS